MKKNMRARDLGIIVSGTPGKYNAITDVAGVEVGYSTLIIGEPSDYVDRYSDFARTGVTAILPRGKSCSAVFAGRHDLNGNGELTGTHWVDDSGFLHGPVMITNTYNVGIVRDTTAQWMVDNNFFFPFFMDGHRIEGLGAFYPVVGETYDGCLNNASGYQINPTQVRQALDSAHGGEIEEGNVGGGTGMRCHGFKGGTGTSSRIVKIEGEDKSYTVGVLVQANHGTREDLIIQGIPMQEITGYEQINNTLSAYRDGTGSIIVVIATDAPLLPHQLSKLCRRATIGIGKLGGGFASGSGDIFVSFSTGNEDAFGYGYTNVTMMNDDLVDPLYKAAAEATEEAILNAMCAAETMVGKDGNTTYHLPTDQVIAILKKHNRM